MATRKPTFQLRCNEQIRISPVRLIGPDNQQIGIVETAEALRLAREAGLDLVEVAPNERPPVCRIMDYGRYKYQQKKHQRRSHEQQLKQVRLRPKTDAHDREIKIRRALEFLRHGDKVQFTMLFRGRERAHRDLAVRIFQEVLAELGSAAKLERPPTMDGRNMIMVVAPGRPGGAGAAARPAPAAQRPAPQTPPPATQPPARTESDPAVPNPAEPSG